MMLSLTSVKKNTLRMLKGRMPGQLVIQMTNQCNARCPQCGMRAGERFPRTRLSNDELRQIVDAAGEKGIQALSFTGGEPMLHHEELAGLIRHAGAAGIPFIRTGTNGFFFRHSGRADFTDKVKRVAENLADTPLRNFWISIDSSVAEIHESMRGFPGVVKGIEKALPIFHRAGLYPSVNLGINRNLTEASRQLMPPEEPAGRDEYLSRFYNEFYEGFRAFYRFVIDLGFTIVNSCYPMSIENDENSDDLNAVYAATSKDRVVNFTGDEKAMIFKALMDVIPEYRSKIRIFSPRTSLYTLYKHYSEGADADAYPCRGGIDFFFINCEDSNTYPCGYRGDDNLGKFQNLDINALDTEARCFACDWECFRDPSELTGPVTEGVTSPLKVMRKMWKDGIYRKLWTEDFRYYKACDYFDGRRDMRKKNEPKRHPVRPFHMRTMQKRPKSFAGSSNSI